MQEYTSPNGGIIDPSATVPDTLWVHEREHPNRAAMSYRDGDAFVDVSTREFAATVRRIAAGFMAMGIKRGDRIGLFSPTRPEFTYFDYAIWTAGGATVTIYDSSSDEQVEWIVKDSGLNALVAANQDLVDVYERRAAGLGTVEHLFSIDGGAIEQLTEAGKDISDDEVMARASEVQGADLATLVYTSGTTGNPKGCHITHTNFVWTSRTAEQAFPEMFYPGASTLFFLPLAHIFARVTQVASVEAGVKMAYSTGIPNLVEELQMVKPTYVFSVPRVFEKIYNTAAAKAADDGKGSIFDKATETAIAFAEQKQAGKVGLGTKVMHTIFDKLVYSKLREVFGGNCVHAISGGAPLGERLGYYFQGIGLNIFEGYGLTETTAASTVGRPVENKVGTVGKPIPGVTVRIAEDGEVLIKGPNIFAGYWNNEAATSESIDADGWFHSGDLGSLDDEGFLRITGRKKEIIVTAGGKNVAPAVLEDRLRAHALVSQCMVVGDAQPFIAAMVTIDPDEYPRWAEQNGKSAAIADMTDDEDLKATIAEAIEAANGAVSKAESIKEFRILPVDFTIEGGEMTPTLKVKRKVVAEKYSDVMSSIYG